MDLTHVLDSEIYVLSCCQADDGADLIALGGEHSVHVVQIVRTNPSLRATSNRAYRLKRRSSLSPCSTSAHA